MEFEQEFSATFGEKYNFLHLKDVIVKQNEGVIIVTFLYPSTDKEITEEQKKEIITWLQKELALEKLKLKVKFMRVFVEERLILKAMQTFLEQKYKLVTTYLSADSYSVKITPIDVLIDIKLSPRLINFFSEHKVVSELSKFLSDNFLTNFTINLLDDSTIVDEVDLDSVQMKTQYHAERHFKVEVIKKIVGGDITPRPEYLSYINEPKKSVVVAGFVKKITRGDFVIKTGKRVGQSKAYFNFQIADERGMIDCVYFCPKTYLSDMEAIEECMFLLLCGDVRVNKLGKLCLYVEKISLATLPEKPETLEEQKDDGVPGTVVSTEKLTALEQDSLFGHQDKYNDKIMSRTIVVFDVETTGLDPTTDQIIELGAVKIAHGNIVEKFSTFVRPTIKIPREVEKLTGISDSMVEDAPPIELVIRDFYEFSKDCTLCGHNIINFDIKFIRRAGDLVGIKFDNEIIDTLNEARMARLNISHLKLGTVVKALGLTLEGAHRAWNDAYATAEVLLKLNEKASNK